MESNEMSWRTFWIIFWVSLITLILFLSVESSWVKVGQIYLACGISFAISSLLVKLYFSWTRYLKKVSEDFETLEKLYERTKKNQIDIRCDLNRLRRVVEDQIDRNSSLKSAVVAALKKLHEVRKEAPQSKADEARKQVLGLNQ